LDEIGTVRCELPCEDCVPDYIGLLEGAVEILQSPFIQVHFELESKPMLQQLHDKTIMI
jgi:hypothetical protein